IIFLKNIEMTTSTCTCLITGTKGGKFTIWPTRGRSSMIRSVISKQYLEMSQVTLYASNIEASAKWYYEMFGFQVLEMNATHAALQLAPGVLFYLSTDEDSERQLSFSTKHWEELRRHLLSKGIEFIEEHGVHWYQFKDPDGNKVGAWKGGFGMEFLETKLPEHVDNEIIRSYLTSKDETLLIAAPFS